MVPPNLSLAATACFLDPLGAADYLEGCSLYHWTLLSVDGGQVAVSNEPSVATDEPLSAPAISTIIGLSRRQLQLLFAANASVSPIRYHRDVRLDLERGLAAQTDMPVLAVAQVCGFASPEHFSRAYCVRPGISPREDRVGGRIPFEFHAWPMHTRGGNKT
jgi:transcriptional regulator GlxA family with amidase domain